MNYVKNFSLEKKLGFTTMLFLLTLFGVAIFSFHRFSAGMTDKLVESISSRNQMLMHDISSMFSKRYSNLQSFMANPVFMGTNRETMEKSLNEYVKAFWMYELIVVTDMDGHIISANSLRNGGKTVNLEALKKWNPEKSDWFKAAVNGKFFEDTEKGYKPFYYGRPALDRVDQAVFGEVLPLSPFTGVIKNEKGTPERIMTLFANVNWMEEELKRTANLMVTGGHGDGSISLFDHDGDWFYSTKDKLVPTGVKFSEKEFTITQEMWSNGKYTGLLSKNDGTKHYVSLNRFEDPKFPKSIDFYVFQSVPESSILGEYRNDVKYFYIVTSMVIAILSFLAYLLYRSISRGFTEKLEILEKVSQKSKEMGDELNSSSQQLSAASSEQASAIQETVSALSEMTSMIAQTSSSSQLSLQSTNSVAEKSEMGRKIMDRLTQTMKLIEERSSEFVAIHQAIRDIQTKTSVINDIVFKTQLLSFNASIEAARAGQEGRGFAVVAEEVGNLAKMSGSAAKEIETLLIESERRVSSSTDLIRQSVNEGAVVGGEATQSFNEIANLIRNIREQVSNVAEATSQQQIGIEEANKAMKQLDITARQNYECAASVESHSKQLLECTQTLVLVEHEFSDTIHGEKVKLNHRSNLTQDESLAALSSIQLPVDVNADDDSFKPAA